MIELHKKLKTNPEVQLFALKALTELADNDIQNISGGIDHIGSGVQAIVYSLGDRIIGIITFGLFEDSEECWIYLSFVESDHRHNGCYKEMYNFLKNYLKETYPNIKTIKSGIGAKNVRMLKIANRIGRKIDSVIMIENI